jgi:uncharacterized damage-inducible protein DinB
LPCNLVPGMKRYFLKLYQYNEWANKGVPDCLSRQNMAEKKLFLMFFQAMLGKFNEFAIF